MKKTIESILVFLVVAAFITLTLIGISLDNTPPGHTFFLVMIEIILVASITALGMIKVPEE